MAIQDYCIGLKGAVNAIHRVTRALSGNVNSTTISDAVEEVAIAIENGGGGGGGGTTDHTKLQNRDSADQHPISAITGLENELNEKANASNTYTKSEVDSSLATKQEKLTAGDNITIENNTISADDEVLVAVYEQTSYADVKAAIDANKAIVLDMSANNNQFCITFATYTNGGNALMYAIYKMNDKATLMTVTLTPTDNWTITHTDLQDKLVSGTNIKTINNTSLLGSGNIDIQGGGGESVVTMSTTNNTPTEVLQAYLSGKVVYLEFGNGEPVLVYSCGEDEDNENHIAGFWREFGDGWVYDVVWKPNYTTNEWGTYDAFEVAYRVQLDDKANIIKNAVNNEILVTDSNGQPQMSGQNISVLGDLASLTTDNKNNLVSAINEVHEKCGIDFEVGVEKPYGTYTDGGTTYQVYSKVIYISALPSTSGITNYPHGVTDIKQVLSMYGICTNGMVMNTPRQNSQDNIGIYQVQKSGGNFAIEVGKDRSSIGAYVTMIYAKNN